MKTIFIPIYQGVEAKNILRTDIFGVLREQNDLRLVLFVPNEMKKNYFAKEFSGSNIVYEVVDQYREPAFNILFTFLRQNMLNTATRDIKRRLSLKEDHNYLRYYSKLIFNRLFAYRFWRRLVRWIDINFVADDNFKAIFDRYQPDLLFSAHLFGDMEASMVREAKKRKIPVIGLVNSWDKVTSRGIIRILPDKLIVHNKTIAAEGVKYIDMKKKDIYISGIPQYDIYFQELGNKLSAKEKDDFYKAMGLDQKKRILLYCPQGSAFSDADNRIMELVDNLITEGKIPNDLQMLVRFPPNDTVEVKKGSLKNAVFCKPGKRFSQKRGVDWDMDFKDIDLLNKTLKFSDLLICFASSITIDAAIFDIPVINMLFMDIEDVSWYYNTVHYKNLLETGGVKMIYNLDDLSVWINKYLSNRTLDAEGRRRIVETQCYKTDGQAGERIAKYILKHL